jgi:hypothetical protein
MRTRKRKKEEEEEGEEEGKSREKGVSGCGSSGLPLPSTESTAPLLQAPRPVSALAPVACHGLESHHPAPNQTLRSRLGKVVTLSLHTQKDNLIDTLPKV